MVLERGRGTSYTLGWILASFNEAALIRLYRESGNFPARELGKKWKRLKIRFFKYFSPPHDSVVVANLRIQNAYEDLCNRARISPILNQWDQPRIYRAMVADAVGDGGETILLEADSFYKRYLFSTGMSAAALLSSIQAGSLLIWTCLLRGSPWTRVPTSVMRPPCQHR